MKIPAKIIVINYPSWHEMTQNYLNWFETTKKMLLGQMHEELSSDDKTDLCIIIDLKFRNYCHSVMDGKFNSWGFLLRQLCKRQLFSQKFNCW